MRFVTKYRMLFVIVFFFLSCVLLGRRDQVAPVSKQQFANVTTMKSFISYPEDCDFPIENLPYGIFSTDNNVSIGK